MRRKLAHQLLQGRSEKFKKEMQTTKSYLKNRAYFSDLAAFALFKKQSQTGRAWHSAPATVLLSTHLEESLPSVSAFLIVLRSKYPE